MLGRAASEQLSQVRPKRVGALEGRRVSPQCSRRLIERYLLQNILPSKPDSIRYSGFSQLEPPGIADKYDIADRIAIMPLRLPRKIDS